MKPWCASFTGVSSSKTPTTWSSSAVPGTGKTHIATALGVQAVEHHRKKVRFFGTINLVNALKNEKTRGRSGQIADRLMRCDLVMLDELGYLPVQPLRRRAASTC